MTPRVLRPCLRITLSSFSMLLWRAAEMKLCWKFASVGTLRNRTPEKLQLPGELHVMRLACAAGRTTRQRSRFLLNFDLSNIELLHGHELDCSIHRAVPRVPSNFVPVRWMLDAGYLTQTSSEFLHCKASHFHGSA